MRATAIEGIGGWVRLHPGAFLTDQYLKYIAWALSDKVRLLILSAHVVARGRGSVRRCQLRLAGAAVLRLPSTPAPPPPPIRLKCPPTIHSPPVQEARVRLAAVNALLVLYSNADNKAALQASGGGVCIGRGWRGTLLQMHCRRALLPAQAGSDGRYANTCTPLQPVCRTSRSASPSALASCSTTWTRRWRSRG